MSGLQSGRRKRREGKQVLLGTLGKGDKELRTEQRRGKEGPSHNPRVNKFQKIAQIQDWSGGTLTRSMRTKAHCE